MILNMVAMKVAALMVLLVPLTSQFPVEPRLKETGRSLPIVISQYSNVGIANQNVKSKSAATGASTESKFIEPKSLDVTINSNDENKEKNKQSTADAGPLQSLKGSTLSDESLNATDQGQEADELAVDQVKKTTVAETLAVNEPVASAQATIADPLPSKESIPKKVLENNEDKTKEIESRKDVIKLVESLASAKTANRQEDEREINEPAAVEDEKKEEKVSKNVVKEAQVSTSEDPEASVTKHEIKGNSFAAEKSDPEIGANEGVDKEAIATKIDSKPKDKAVASFKESDKSSQQKITAKIETKLDKLKVTKTKAAEAKTEETKTEEAKTEEAKTEEVKTEEAKTEEPKVEEAETEEAKKKEVKTDKVKTEEAKTEETKTEVKTEEVKTEEVKTEEVKTEEAKTEELKVEEAKTEEAKKEEVKTDKVKTEEAKTQETKTEEVKTEEPKVEQAKTEEAKKEEVKTEKVKTEEAKTEETKVTEAETEEAKTEETKAEKAKAEKAGAEKAKSEETKVEEAKAEATKAEETKAVEKSENEDTFDNQTLPALTADEMIEEDRSFKSSPEILNLEAVQQRASTTGLDKKTLANLSQLDIIVDKTRLEEFNGAARLESDEKKLLDEKRLNEKKFDEKKEKDVKEIKEKDKAKLLSKLIKETKPFKQAKLNLSLANDDPVNEYEEPVRKRRSQ